VADPTRARRIVVAMNGRGRRVAALAALTLLASLLAGCPGRSGPAIAAEVAAPDGYRIVWLAGAPDGSVWLMLAAQHFLDDTEPAAALMHVGADGRDPRMVTMPRPLMTPSGGMAVDGNGVVWFGLNVGTATRPTIDTGPQLADPHGEIGRLDGNRVVEYPVPGLGAAVISIAGAASGAWFTADTNDGPEYGQVSASGLFSAYPGPGGSVGLEAVLSGPHDSVWLVDGHACTLTLVTPGAPWPASPTANVCGKLLPGPDGGLHVLAGKEVTSLSADGTVTGHVPVPVETGDSGAASDAAAAPGAVWVLTHHQVTPGIDYTVPVLWQIRADGGHRRLLPIPAEPVNIPTAAGTAPLTPAPTLLRRLEEADARLVAAGPAGRLWLASFGLLMLVDTGGAS
jgi:hypothetical protein